MLAQVARSEVKDAGGAGHRFHVLGSSNRELPATAFCNNTMKSPVQSRGSVDFAVLGAGGATEGAGTSGTADREKRTGPVFQGRRPR